MDLPDDLRIGLEETLHTTTPKSLAHLAEDLSRRYRTGHTQGKQAFLRSEEDIIAYAAHPSLQRLPPSTQHLLKYRRDNLTCNHTAC
jgi:hypothetical protein